MSSDEKIDDKTSILAEETAQTDSDVTKAGQKKRLTRCPPLSRVDEEVASETFGVRSYLHNFYDSNVYKDPSVYEDELRFLFSDSRTRKRRCTSLVWKVFVWIGANLLIFGTFAVLIGFLVPPHDVIVETRAENIDVIDRNAISFNANLEACRLFGLVLFCMGGITLTMALLFPSCFLRSCAEDERLMGAPRGETKYVAIGESAPRSPVDKNVPATGQLTTVQPDRKRHESIVTKDGLVEYE